MTISAAFLEQAPVGPASVAARAPNLAVETIKVVGLRRRIAQNMAESTRRVAHFSYVEEIDVTSLEEARAALNGDDSRPRLTLLPFLMLAIVKAVAQFPQINAHYDDEEDVIRRFGAVHLGVATQTPSGLTVPVVRHAETLDLYGCAREMKRVSDAARAGLGAREEMSGSTITLTSLGAPRRHRLDAGRQPAGGRHRRRQQDRGEAGVARQCLRSAQDHEPVVLVRSSRRRRLRRGELHPAPAGAAGAPGAAVRGGMGGDEGELRCKVARIIGGSASAAAMVAAIRRRAARARH